MAILIEFLSDCSDGNFLAEAVTNTSASTPLPFVRHTSGESSPLALSIRSSYSTMRSMKGIDDFLENNDVDHELEDEIIDSSPREQNWARVALLMVAILNGVMDVAARMIFVSEDPPSSSSVACVKSILQVAILVPFMAFAGGGEQSRDEVGGAYGNETIPRKNVDQIAVLGSSSLTSSNSLIRLVPAAVTLATLVVFVNELLFAGYSRVDAATGSFLFQLSVIFTPILEMLFLRRSQPVTVWVGAAVALAGLAMLASTNIIDAVDDSLTHDAPTPSPPLSVLLGEGFIVGAALSWAAYCVKMAAIPSDVSPVMLQGFKNGFACMIYTVWTVTEALVSRREGKDQVLLSLWEVLFRGWNSLRTWGLLCFLGFGGGALGDVLQQMGQSKVLASEACLILSAEPLFAALLSVPLLGEFLSAVAYGGGFLIVVSIFIASGALRSINPCCLFSRQGGGEGKCDS